MASTTSGAADAGSASGKDVRAHVTDVVNKAKDTVHKVAEDVRQVADDAEHNGREVAEQARAHFDRATERAEQQVREKPLSSALALLAIGLVAGFLLRGSQR